MLCSSEIVQLSDRGMTPQPVLDQKGGEISTTAPLGKRMALQLIHYPSRQRHVDSLRTGCLGHLTGGWNHGTHLDSLLQLTHQILKN